MNIQTLLIIAVGTLVLFWLTLGLLIALTTPMEDPLDDGWC